MEKYCIFCGTSLNQNGVCPRCGYTGKTPTEQSFESPLCPDCGVPFNANGICPRCGNKLSSAAQPNPKITNIIYSDDTPVYDTPIKKKKSAAPVLIIFFLFIATLAVGVYFFRDRIFPQDSGSVSDTDTKTTLESSTTESTTTTTVPMANYPPEFAYYTASSCYDKDEANTSSADDAFDLNTNTCWQDGQLGYGEGETLTAYAYSEQLIYSVTIYNGYQKSTQSSKFYKYNSRVKEFTIYYEGGSETFVLEDTKEPQTFSLSEPVITTYITFEINSVYKGSKYKDTCVTDIVFN